MKKRFFVLVLILLLCLAPANYLYLQHVAPLNLQDKSFQYTGKCVNIDREIKEFGKTNRIMYLLSMEDGREFWVDSIYAEQGKFDVSDFYKAVPDNVITVRYIDFNYSLGSFAKKAVEIQAGSKTLLAIDAVAESFKKTHIVIWIAYVVCLTLFSIPLIFSIQNERAQRKLTAHRQQTKAKRREWLDAHPEEKGAPPAPDAKRTAIKHPTATGRRNGGLWHTAWTAGMSLRS